MSIVPAEPRPRRGLVLGKFLPPHAGHVFLCDVARHTVDSLCIVVGSLQREPIPGRLRVEWMRELFPSATVIHLDRELPQDPSETPEFWPIWRSALESVLPWRPDVVFASEGYGARLADELGAEFRPVDVSRDVFPVSGTEVRADPYRAWSMVPATVRPWFVRRVAIVGPESTGKTTLATALAEHFQTACVPEYARILLEPKGGRLDPGDFDRIAQGQRALEEALARQANRILICDTDLLSTTLWAETLLGHCPEWIRVEADARDYDLTLVTDVDVPYEPDPVRYRPDTRAEFLQQVEAALTARGRRFVKVSGSKEIRLKTAIAEVERLFSPDAPRPVRQRLLARAD